MATQGAIIRAVDYNTIQSNVSNILGPGSGDFGYGQSLISSQVLPNLSNPAGIQTIEANDWAKLKIDILKIANHQGTAGNPAVASIPNIVPGIEIDDVQITSFENAIPVLTANRFSLAEFTDESFSPTISQTRTTAWGSPSTTTIRHSFTVDFGSPSNARWFFNSGSQLRFNASRSGGSPSAQNTSWTNLLSSMGTVIYNIAGSTASSGTTSAIGFYSLTNIPQTVFTKTGFENYLYEGNDYTITISCDVANNSTGTARYIYVAVYFNDDYSGPFTDSVTGTITHNVTMRRATGSNVSVAKPTAVNTVLLTA